MWKYEVDMPCTAAHTYDEDDKTTSTAKQTKLEYSYIQTLLASQTLPLTPEEGSKQAKSLSLSLSLHISLVS